MALPRVLDHAAERHDGGNTDERAAGSECPDHRLTATESRGLPRVVQFRDDRLTVDVFRRTIVTGLYRNLGRNELLGELDRADTDGEDRSTEGDTQKRGVQAVVPVTVVLPALVVPGPGDVNDDEREREQRRERKPEGHASFGSLFRARFDLFGPAGLAVGDFHSVELRSELEQLVVAHPVQFRGRRLLNLAHERVPIHRVAPTRATIPINHMAAPSVTGPRPPRA